MYFFLFTIIFLYKVIKVFFFAKMCFVKGNKNKGVNEPNLHFIGSKIRTRFKVVVFS